MALMRGLSAGGTWRNCRAHGDGQPVFDDLRRCNGAKWKRGPVKRFVHGSTGVSPHQSGVGPA